MIQRTGNKRLAVVGWGRGMGHKGHMYLASSVITQAHKMNADAYFFVSKTVGKDDPIFPEEKVKIYQTVFPQQAPIFQPQGNLNQALTDLAQDGYQGVVLVVGADQKDAFKYLERPNKEGVPVFQSMGLKKLRVISRQETGDTSAGLEGPRATPMREVLLHPDATEEQKFKVWRDAMPDALGDNEVMDLMKKAEARLMGSRPKKTKVAESFSQSNPNQVAELLYKVKPEIFSRFGDDFVMDAITQACEQHQGSAQEVAGKVVEILKQGLQESRKYKCTCHPGDSDPDCPVHGLEPMEVGDALDVKEGEEEALAYATQAHAGQTRSGGDPYITHPMRVADHIRQYKQSHNLDALISAAYLHDTIEDTDTTQEILHDLFGGLVASLVKELTSDPEQIKKMGKAAYLSHKMAAMSSYGLVIKLADRLDNVKDITTARTPQWRAKYAAETNQILDYIEKTRALTGTHNKLISLIRAKLAEIDNPQQEVEEAAGSLGLRTWSGQVKLAHGKDVKFYNRKNDTIDRVVAMQGQKLVGIFDRATDKGRVIDEGITRRGILKGIAGAGALGAAGKASAIAGAFPTPSAQQAMYKAAADSNRAEAKRQAELKAKADSERLKTNTDLVDKEQRVNHHKLDEFAPGNGDDDKPTAEYEVYQCQLDDQFDWIGGPLFQSDDMGKVHGFAYDMWKKHPDKCFMIWQERSQGSRGGYGPEGSVLAPSQEDLSENNDYLDEK